MLIIIGIGAATAVIMITLWACLVMAKDDE